jgi:holo-[acyl-carrier protein] synthase
VHTSPPFVVGIGIDLIKRSRIEAAITRWGSRFLDRIFTPREQRDGRKYRDASLHYAGRFAVKEALLKAVGTGWRRGVTWREIEVTNEPGGRPRVAVSGGVSARLRRLHGSEIFVSISHDTDYAVAQVLITRLPADPTTRRTPTGNRR